MKKHLIRQAVCIAFAALFLTSLVSANGSKVANAPSAPKTLAVICTSDTLGILEPCG